MMTAARNVSINSNQFEILQLVGVTESCYEDTKILQFHPGQAICRCKVSSNGRVDGPGHKERTVYARCCSYIPTFQEISRAKSCSDCTEMCKISVLHVQSCQPDVVLLIKPLIIYWAFLLQSPDCSRCNCQTFLLNRELKQRKQLRGQWQQERHKATGPTGFT